VHLQITFRDIPHSDAVEGHVARLSAKLERLHERIVVCRVVVAVPHRRHHHGKRYRCQVEVIVPGGELVVGGNPPERLDLEDMHAAIDAAFDDVDRMLREHASRLRERRKVTSRAARR